MIRFSSHADGHMQHASNEEMILLRTATQKMGRKKRRITKRKDPKDKAKRLKEVTEPS